MRLQPIRVAAFTTVLLLAAAALSEATAVAQTTSPDRVLASVRVGQHGGCSATIIKTAGKHAWGLSAAHCATRVGDEFTFGNPDGSTGKARWVAIDRSNDLALFITWSEDVLAAAKIAKRAVPNYTTTIDAVGYPRTQGPKYKTVSYKGQSTINNNMSRTVYNVSQGPFAGGDSGGGVFYDGEWLIGVMTHGHDNRTIYAATHEQMITFLEANRAKFHGVEPFS